MKEYIKGYYVNNPQKIEQINTEQKREVLQAFRNAYPEDLTIQEISKNTGKDESTVNDIVKKLEKEHFIVKQGKRKYPGKPRMGKKRGHKPASTYRVEELNFALNQHQEFEYQFAPGSVEYDKKFLDMYDKIVQKTDQDVIYPKLVQLLERIFTRINASGEERIIQVAPETKKDFICSTCGLNHHTRDFIRAVLLHLLDQLEISDKYIKFLRNKEFISDEAFNKLANIASSSKSHLLSNRKEGVITLRILSINKSVEKSPSMFLALNSENEFVGGLMDYELVSDINNNSMIECIPTILDVNTYGNFMQLCEGDYIKTINDDPSFPTSKQSTIEEMCEPLEGLSWRERRLHIVDGIILKEPEITERFLHGQRFSAIDTVIYHNGQQIRLVGHCNLETELQVGDRIRVIGAVLNYQMAQYGDEFEVEKEMLRVSPYGSITLIEKKTLSF